MSEQPNVFGYGRASTKKQEDSPEVQKEKINGFMPRSTTSATSRMFIDPAKSGKVAWQDREGGRALFGRLKRGDHIIIAKLDRAFRRLADCVVVLEQFERMGVKLHVVNLLGGAIDLSSPMGWILVAVLAGFATGEGMGETANQGRTGEQEATRRCSHSLSGLRLPLAETDDRGQVGEGQGPRRRRAPGHGEHRGLADGRAAGRLGRDHQSPQPQPEAQDQGRHAVHRRRRHVSARRASSSTAGGGGPTGEPRKEQPQESHENPPQNVSLGGLNSSAVKSMPAINIWENLS